MTPKGLYQKFFLIGILFLIGDLAIYYTLKKGMDTYYGMNTNTEILLVGHSHTVLGLDGEQLQKEMKKPVAKYATAGANVLDRYWMIRQYVEEHPSVKVVVYDVDPRLFDSEGLSSSSYTLFLPYIDNAAMSQYLKQEGTWQEYYSSMLIRTSRFRDQTLNIAFRGLLGKIENKKTGILRIEDYTHYLRQERERKIRINSASVQCFQETIDYLKDKGIPLVLLFIPVAEPLNAIDPDGQKKVTEIFINAAKNNNVFYLDYNQHYQSDFKMFYDLRHLNAAGNLLVTKRLGEDLQTYFDGK